MQTNKNQFRYTCKQTETSLGIHVNKQKPVQVYNSTNRKQFWCTCKQKKPFRLGFSFTKFLRNKTQNFSFVAHQFSKSHFVQNFPIPFFCNLNFAQFRKFVVINHACVFLGMERFLAGIRIRTVKMRSDLMGAHFIHNFNSF